MTVHFKGHIQTVTSILALVFFFVIMNREGEKIMFYWQNTKKQAKTEKRQSIATIPLINVNMEAGLCIIRKIT